MFGRSRAVVGLDIGSSAVKAVELKGSGKSYKVTGWASVNAQTGKPVWDVVASHLRAGKAAPATGSGVTLKGVEGNPGIAETT